jgi:hypothetical protein
MIPAFNVDLAAIYRWSAENGLLLNPRKSQAILISNSAVGMMPLLSTDLRVVIDGRICFDR